MSSDMPPKHAEVLAILRGYLDATAFAIVESALVADSRMAVIRDAFLEGRDHEAVNMLRELDPAKPRMLLPMSTPQDLRPAEVAMVTARPQVGPFRPVRLLVSRSCAGYFDINDIRIGTRSQFAQSGNVPADAFEVDAPGLDVLIDGEEPVLVTVTEKEARFGIALDLDLVAPSQELILIVTNQSDQPRRFRAAWIGEVDRAAARWGGGDL